jgi:DNA glycosylase AlkZ-like
MLLVRRRVEPLRAIEHLVGIQSQLPLSPYYALFARIEGFQPRQLAELIEERRAVRLAMMRSTIYLVSATDCLQFRNIVQPAADRLLHGTFGRSLSGLDLAEVTSAGVRLVEQRPCTLAELGELLSKSWPSREPAALANTVRARVPLVQVPPRGVWGASGRALHTTADAWLGRGRTRKRKIDDLIMRYLAAHGPASVADAQFWTGLSRLQEVFDVLGAKLRTFRDQNGVKLFDLPDAPLPSPQASAPVRFLPEFDSAILAHADRERIVPPDFRRRMATSNGLLPGTVLVDGFVRGVWKILRSARSTTLRIELFAPTAKRDLEEMSHEGHRLLQLAEASGQMDVHLEWANSR